MCQINQVICKKLQISEKNKKIRDFFSFKYTLVYPPKKDR